MIKNYILRKLIKEFVSNNPDIKEPITIPEIKPKRRPLKPSPDLKPDIRPKANNPEIKEPITKPDIRPKRRPLKPDPNKKPDIRPKAFTKKENRMVATILKRFKKMGGYKSTLNEDQDDLRSALGGDWYDKKTREKGEEYAGRNPNPSRMMNDVNSTINKERNHREKLESLAVEIVENFFPVIKDLDVIINAELVDRVSGVNNVSTERSEKIFDDVMQDQIKKRRVINAMTQGGAANVMNITHMVKNELDEIDPELIDLYKATDENKLFYWKTSNDVLKDMIVMGTKMGMAHGLVNVEYKRGAYYINAQAVTFNILIHEIVKGIFEILALHGFTEDKDKNQEIADYVDFVGNEPEDLKYGELLFENIRDFFFDNFESEIDEIPTLKEHFLSAIYQLPANRFLEIIQGVLNDNSRIKNELTSYLQEVYVDVKQDQQDDLFN